MDDARYVELVNQYSAVYSQCNRDPALLAKRWRSDEELRLIVNMIHDLLHAPSGDPQAEDFKNRIKQEVPDITDDELKFISITSVILGYWRAEA